jgi:DNA-binding CsgD family transcriptional regulator
LWCSTGIDPQVFRDYASYYHHVDVFMQSTAAQGLLRTGAVLRDDELVDPETMRRSPFVNELLRPSGLGPRCGSTLYVDRRGDVVQLSFYRRPGAERFDARSVGLLRRLVPHLGRAARLRRGIAAAGSLPGWTCALLNGLPWGVVLLDGLAHPALVNAEAERIARQADGFGIDRHGPYATHVQDAARLRRLVARALCGESGGAGRGGGDLALRRPSGAPALLVTVVPLGVRAWDGLETGAPRAALHLVDPMREPYDEAGRLAALFGLSPAEQRLALGLVAELTLKEIADLHGVLPSTIKTQLESLFAKTGKSRQSTLVRLLHQTLALPRVPKG